MNTSSIIFTVKCSAILYFAAFAQTSNLTTIKSATPRITKGSWKIEFINEAGKSQPQCFSCYTLVFGSAGELKAVNNGVEIDGNWSEDNISKRININLGKEDPQLAKLNDYWNIKDIADLQVNLQNCRLPLLGLRLKPLN